MLCNAVCMFSFFQQFTFCRDFSSQKTAVSSTLKPFYISGTYQSLYKETTTSKALKLYNQWVKWFYEFTSLRFLVLITTAITIILRVSCSAGKKVWVVCSVCTAITCEELFDIASVKKCHRLCFCLCLLKFTIKYFYFKGH